MFTFSPEVLATTTVVEVNPSTSTVATEETFDINITVNQVANLTAWQFILYFRNDVLNCTNVSEGPFLKSAGNTFFNKTILNDYNGTHGQILAYLTLLGPVSVSGSGVIATITFKAVARGNTTLHLDETLLCDEKIPPQPIPHTTADGTVQVVTMLKVDPSSFNATIGDNFQINITVIDIANFTAWQFTLYFKNDVLNCTGVSEGPFLKSAGGTFFNKTILNNYNSTHGQILAYSTLLGPVSVSGSGVIATITFKAKNCGVTILHLSDTQLADEKIPPKPIPHKVIDGKVTVRAPFTEVAISPSSLTGPPGWIGINDTFTVNLTVSGVTDLIYWQAGLSFNPTVLQCLDFIEGPFLQKGGTTIWQPGIINNDEGIITPYGCTLTAKEGVSGNGTLAFLTFKVKDIGVSSLILENVILLDSSYNKIAPVTLQNGYFELPSAVPKPPTAYFNYYPLTPYVNQTITFDASYSTPNGGIITSYDWDFGDDTHGQGMIVNHTYTDPGEYNVTLIVTDDENLTGSFSRLITVLALPPGASIDVYTQRDGKGLGKPSDAFAPDELVLVTAYYTYNAAPVAGKLITFNLYSPNGTNIISRVSETDDNGIAFITFLIESKPDFGLYSLNASTPYGEQMISDFLEFRVGWLVEILEAIPCDRHGVPKITFKKEEPLYLTVKVRNIRLYSTKATLTVTVFDETQQPILFEAREYLLQPNQTILLLNVGSIPTRAFVGYAIAYVNAFQRLGGSPYCPEVAAIFRIVRSVPNVALISVTASPSEVYVGQCVRITFTALNDYNKPQSFNVTIYANSTAIQTLTITDLGPFVEANFTCIWDTYPFSPANYVISAQASIVPEETQTDDNTFVNGFVHVLPRTTPTHDVAVTSVQPKKTIVATEHFLLVDVIIQNQGDYMETVNVTICANQTVIATISNINLASGNSTTITAMWNTSGFSRAWMISANVTILPGETDIDDNTVTDGFVLISCTGDVNGDYKTDIKDYQLVKNAIPSTPSSPNWNPNYDINDDYKIDIKDYQIVKIHIPSYI
jgi:PKD repeat protein